MKRSYQNGFTLLELLVSLTVLAVVLLVFAQIFTQTTDLSKRETRRLSSFSGAVGAFDRLAMDLSRRVRGDSTLAVTNNGKTLSFFAQVSNTDGASRISVVTYLIKDGKLLRQVEPVDWTSNPIGPVPATNGDILSDQVFGLQFSFMRRDGLIYPDAGTKFDQNGAIIATFASMDSRSRARFPNAESLLGVLNDSLTGVSETGSEQTPLFYWSAGDQPAGESDDSIRNQASYYERHYPLD